MTHLYTAFREIAEKYPTRLALVGDDAEHTYHDALMRIAELGQHLAGDGHAAVLVVEPKQCDTVLWQLACNQAGQVFVPCDASTPAARLSAILRRTQPRWIVSDFGRDFSAEGYLVLGEVDRHRIWSRPEFLRYDPQVSHVIFSSGSTGQPKAILLRDAPVLDVVRAQAALLGLGPHSRFAWLLSPAFDASLSDIYATLLTGGTLHVCGFGPSRLKTLKAYCEHHRITHTDVPPSVLALLDPADFPHMQALVFGGELASEVAVQAWVRSGKRLFNAYGPTEATICCSMRKVDASWTATNIGLPLPGVVYGFRAVQGFSEGQIGDSGELCIAGDHLAIGYDVVELTAQRFAQTGDTSYYLTGDMAEVDARGDYHFKGRVDRQMKYHGVLVCPEEVESLARRAGGHEAWLRLEDERLVLYYSGPVEALALKAALQLHLIPAMVPQRYCHIDALPKSLTGKSYAPQTNEYS